MGILLVVQGLLPPLSVWLVKVVVDDVVGHASISQLILLIAVWAVAALIAGISPISGHS